MLFRRESHIHDFIGPIGLLVSAAYCLWQIVKIIFHLVKLLFVGIMMLCKALKPVPKTEKREPLKQKMRKEREAKWHEYE